MATPTPHQPLAPLTIYGRVTWQRIGDDDKALLPLLECLTSISQALGRGFAPFAAPVFSRCIGLIEATLNAEAAAQQSGGELPDKEFVVCALDLISGMTEGMSEQIAPLVQSATPRLQAALLQCMRDAQADVRQSAFALVGDLAKACIDQLRAYLGEYLPVMTVQLLPDAISVCNNASWAIGEIAVKVRDATRCEERTLALPSARPTPRTLHHTGPRTLHHPILITPSSSPHPHHAILITLTL
jgi:transportin-1